MKTLKELEKRNMTVDQMSRANALIQQLVEDCNRAWNGKRNGHTAFDTYDKVEQIYKILHEGDGDENRVS